MLEMVIFFNFLILINGVELANIEFLRAYYDIMLLCLLLILGDVELLFGSIFAIISSYSLSF